MRHGIKRVLILSFNNPNEAAKFVEYISYRLKGNLLVSIRNKKVVFTIYGDRDEVEKMQTTILKGAKDWKLSQRTEKGFFKHSVSRVLREAKLSTSIPLGLIIDALRGKGFETRINKGYFVSKASYMTVLETARNISEIYSASLNLPLTPSVRYLVVLTSFLYDLNLHEALIFLARRRIVQKNSKTGRYTLSTSLEKAIEEVINMKE